MLSYQANVNSPLTSPQPADVSSASLLKSVREQEAQFERLARQLEVERESVTHRSDKPGPFSPTSPNLSMNSVRQDETSYPWASPFSSSSQPLPRLDNEESADTSKMNSNLLDSCLRELEDRGTLNTGYHRDEGAMDYMHPDYSHGGGDSFYSPQAPYSGGGGGGGGGNYANTSFDRGSHASLQSNGSNRPRQAPRVGDPLGAGGGNYSPYGHPDDVRSSPMPRDDYPGSRGSYNRPADGYDGQGYNDNYADPPYAGQPSYRDSPMGDPNLQPHQYTDYPDDRDVHQGPPHNDSYRQSPYHSQDYAAPPPNGHDDPYSDRHNDSLPPRHDDSFQGMRPGEAPGHFNQPSYEQDRYSDAPRQRASYDHDGPQGQYGPDEVPRYRGSYDHEGPLDESGGPRYRGSYGPEDPQDGYLNPPPEENAPPRYHDDYEHQGPAYGAPAPEDDGRYDPRIDPTLYDESPQKYDGLPAVQSDPFADDPFRDQRSHDGSFSALREDPYNRGASPYNQGPAPSGDTRPPDDYGSHPYNGSGGPPYDDYTDSRPYPEEIERPYYPEEEEMVRRMDAMNVAAPPGDNFRPDDRRTPSIDGRPPGDFGGFIRPPDLQEVIDYLNYPDDSVKANAAAYLQHLSYNDDGIKAKTRGLGGIPLLVQLLNHELVEVHKNACGALQNLSFGKSNDENKKAIRNEGGVPELIRLLRKTDQEDVMDAVTGILWNLSSCEDLKAVILDEGLTVLVNVVVLPYSGWNTINSQPSQRPWTTVFRNTTGILRNVSSAGYEARKKLRECRGLVNALIHTLHMADEDLMNCKAVENVVCTLRNLSYRIQEMEDPDFYKKRSLPRGASAHNKGGQENAGCFGGSSKKSTKKGSIRENQPQMPPPNLPASSTEYRALWGNDLILLYLGVVKNCTNPVSIEAAAGAIQNLTACDWAPAVECRAFIRKAKGLPNLVDLLNKESHRVVCAAATALRNLTIDNTNKELIGKYSIQQLVAWLPRDTRHSANQAPDDLTCAVLATLYEVIRSNQNYAVSLIQEDGLARLKYINTSDGKYLARTLKINHTILKTLWSFKALHPQYARTGFAEEDFTHSKAIPRHERGGVVGNFGTMPSSNHTTPYGTLSRPISGQGYDDNTLTAGRMPRHDDRGNYSHHGGSRMDMDGYLAMNQSNPALYDQSDRGNYSRDRLPPDSVPMNDLGPGYAPLDEPRPHKKPVGGVPLFPNLPPGASAQDLSSQQDLTVVAEPLYAQVNKGRRRNDDYARQGGPVMDAGGQGGADSWV
ncbi:splicing regulator ARVCF-like isoform X2 [Littorina saxatilis]|uniref:splicing regulator ARVCF-like isoform X2 n=1 Tax=Littorina saxatilis TaxID=31220 RepID=UPI0038B519BC